MSRRQQDDSRRVGASFGSGADPNASSDDDDDDDEGDEEFDANYSFSRLLKPSERKESRLADRLSVRLLAIDDENEEEQNRVLQESLNMVITQADKDPTLVGLRRSISSGRRLSRASLLMDIEEEAQLIKEGEKAAKMRMQTMLCFAVVGLTVLVVAGYFVSVKVVGPPNQPMGPYEIVEVQEGSHFFDFYSFYEGRDSAGSAGYNTYVSMARAQSLGIINITMEPDILDVFQISDDSDNDRLRRRRRLMKPSTAEQQVKPDSEPERPKQRAENETSNDDQTEPFIYMGSASTVDGPRESIRLEGNRRFNRGLFVIDVRHMPAGCGVWPAFWLTDEANWPVNGEIDIVEGVNYQSQAKTALHSTIGCNMNDNIPYGVMTGSWDTAQGIPDSKTGIPDMTMRYAKNCFVYDPHQWLNQGCVTVSDRNDTLGAPLNDNGGGVFVLEWDPIYRHIRTWAFTPHGEVPDNLVESIRTAHEPDNKRVLPDPETWPIPYGYYAIGDGTACPSSHFRNMRLVFNTAFCGSVAGNRFQMDCPLQAKKFKTCNDYLKSQPDELKEAYWKIRGVYVYERKWEKRWLD